MLKILKYNSLKKHIEKNLLERDVTQRNAPLKQLGFLVDETSFDDFEMLYDFGKELGIQQKDIKLFTFVETRRKIPSLRQNQITNKEFTWRGEIQSQNALEFLNFPFDVLIGFYNDQHKFLSAMVAQSKAKFKIGINATDERMYDLLLAVDPQNQNDFKKEVKKYLKLFKKI